jgi:PAS domain S-box-containing protein
MTAPTPSLHGIGKWLQLLFENLEEYAIIFLDVEGRIVIWGEGAVSQLGYSESEAIGRNADFLFTLEDRSNGLFKQEMKTATEEGRATDENWLVRKDGSQFWASGALTALRDESETLLGFGKIFRDLTVQRQTELELRESRERLRSSLAAARMGIWTLDVETDVHMRDENLNRLLGLPPAESHQPFAEFLTHIHPDDRAKTAEAFKSSVERKRDLNVEFRVVHPDGTTRWLRDQGDIFGESENSLQMAGACMDVTERVAAEEEIRRARDDLEVRVNERTGELKASVLALKAEAAERRQAQKARQDLLARLVNAQEAERQRVARELHDILGQFVAALNLKLKSMKEQASDGRTTPAAFDELFHLTKEIGQETHRLATELRPRALDDVGLRGALQQLLESWSERTKIPVDFASRGLDGEEFPTEIATAIYRIVQEALTNVARHAKSSRVDVVIEKNDGLLVTVVEDDGNGFVPEDEQSRKRAVGGLGILGMKERATLVGGRLQIESTPGNGTSIFVKIPLPGGGADHD